MPQWHLDRHLNLVRHCLDLIAVEIGIFARFSEQLNHIIINHFGSHTSYVQIHFNFTSFLTLFILISFAIDLF